MGAKIEKYAVVRYRPAVAEPRAACRSRLVELVLRPPAIVPVITVAIKGAVVIKPRRWWILSMWERLLSRACSWGFPFA